MRFLFILVLVNFSLINFTKAQTVEVRGGLTLGKPSIINNGEKYTPDLFHIKFQFGILTNIETGIKNVNFETGIVFSQKGFRIGDSYLFGYDDVPSHGYINYIDFPLHLKYLLGGQQKRGYIILGPYISCGINGTGKFEPVINGTTEVITEDFYLGSKENDDLRRIDYGLDIGLGINFWKFTLSGSYGIGLANIAPQSFDSSRYSNRIIKVELGYKLVE